MRHKLISDAAERTHVLIFDSGDEVISVLQQFCVDQHLTAARFTAIGALSGLTLGYFDWDKKDYDKIELSEQVEVLSLVGDVALKEGKPALHAHIVIGKRDGSAHGGHLMQARVRPTLEVVLIESPGYLKRTIDAESCLALIDIDA